MRIVSLLPSATEIVCALGMREQLVGVTHECDFPSSVVGLPIVTRSRIPADASSREIDELVRQQWSDEPALYSLDVEMLAALNPELLITQKLCDVCAVAESEVASAVESLASKPTVLTLEPECLEDVFQSIRDVGAACQPPVPAEQLLASLEQRIQVVKVRATARVRRPTVVLLEWIDPPFSAGHWNPELIEIAGGRPLLGTARKRSRQMEWDEIASVNPELMIVACCGFDRQRSQDELRLLRDHPQWNSLSCVQRERVHVLDGSAFFNRPGPRLIDSMELVADAIDQHGW